MDEAHSKKELAWRLSDAFMHGVYGEPMFPSRYDRAMCVMVLVARFLMMENVTPDSFLHWLDGKVRQSVIPGDGDDERRKSCH